MKQTDPCGTEEVKRKQPTLPLSIWLLGLVSFFSNSASVVISALSSVFIIDVLKASTADVGVIRGLSESLSYLVKLFSGVLSDYIGKRKVLILIGYSCAALAKPIFAVSQKLSTYVFAQLLERVTNGLRDTPRDALISDYSPKELKGASYGIRQMLAFGGSMFGAVACYYILSHSSTDTETSMRIVYLVATIPLIVAVGIIYFGIKEPANISGLKNRKGFPIKSSDLAQLDRHFWYYIGICFIFMCSRYSEAFLVLRATEFGLGAKFAPLILAVMYLFNAPVSKLVGSWSDKKERKFFLAFGFCMMLASCIVLALAKNYWHVVIGAAIYGIHYGATQGTFYAMVSDYSPAHIKGTSFGIFNLVCCIGMGVSNVLTGFVWQKYGAENTLLVISCIVFIAIIGVMFVKNDKQRKLLEKA